MRGSRGTRGVIAAAALMALGAVAGCGILPVTKSQRLKAGGPAVVNANTVTILNFRYRPEQETVRPNSTLTFKNLDGKAHTATADPGQAIAFDTGRLGEGDSTSITFGKHPKPGIYAYHCKIHPRMKGRIEVAQ